MVVAVTIFAAGVASVSAGAVPHTGLIADFVWLLIATSCVATVSAIESE